MTMTANFAKTIGRETQLEKPLARGARGTAVRRLQEWLTLHGLGLKPDGSFGPATEAAVRTFQAKRSLRVSGEVDQVTFAACTAPILDVLKPIRGSGVLGEDAVACAEQHLAQHPREVGGPNRGPWVRLYMNGSEGEEFPWCAGFACFVLGQAAALPFDPSVSCDEIGASGKKRGIFVKGGPSFDTSRLQPGSLFLVRRPDKPGWHHTGIVIGMSPNAVTTIEGNTNDSGSREGFEVCRRVRATKALDFVVLPA
jgi:hypothetical protein